MTDVVTFTITLPTGGMFKETIEGLKAARDVQAKLGNMDAAQVLHTIVVLSEGGLHLFNTSSLPVVVPDSSFVRG